MRVVCKTSPATAAFALGLAFFSLNASPGSADERMPCVTEHPRFAFADASSTVGFELINVLKREVWATREWTKAEFESFDLPLSYAFWRKNSPRISFASRAEFLKSPGCEIGEFTYLKAFDRQFLQVVSLKRPVSFSDDTASLKGVILEKYHRLVFDAGTMLSFISAPTGQTYIAVTRSAANHPDEIALPAGWQFHEQRLATDLTIDLTVDVTVLRTSNDMSFQGPVALPFDGEA